MLLAAFSWQPWTRDKCQNFKLYLLLNYSLSRFT